MSSCTLLFTSLQGRVQHGEVCQKVSQLVDGHHGGGTQYVHLWVKEDTIVCQCIFLVKVYLKHSITRSLNETNLPEKSINDFHECSNSVELELTQLKNAKADICSRQANLENTY